MNNQRATEAFKTLLNEMGEPNHLLAAELITDALDIISPDNEASQDRADRLFCVFAAIAQDLRA